MKLDGHYGFQQPGGCLLAVCYSVSAASTCASECLSLFKFSIANLHICSADPSSDSSSSSSSNSSSGSSSDQLVDNSSHASNDLDDESQSETSGLSWRNSTSITSSGNKKLGKTTSTKNSTQPHQTLTKVLSSRLSPGSTGSSTQKKTILSSSRGAETNQQFTPQSRGATGDTLSRGPFSTSPGVMTEMTVPETRVTAIHSVPAPTTTGNPCTELR